MLVSNPEGYKSWDYALNYINPDEEPLKQGETYHWRCEKGHKYTKKYQKVLQDPECKYCNMDLVTDNPDMMKFWDKDKNSDLDPFYISSTNKEIPINWHCSNCGHDWQTAALIRKRSTGKCPNCNDDPKFSRQSITLFEDNPVLVRQYAGTKDVLKEPISLNEPLDWKCDDCGYEWSKPLRERFKSGNLKQCPNCRGRRFKNHIVDKYPEIRKMFSPNNMRDVDSLTGNDYNNKFLWVCDKHGEFEQTLYIIINELEGKSIACPYCSGKLARREESIGYLYPELVKEYSSSNELDIYYVSPKSSKMAKWLCKNCGNEYSSSFKSRASGTGGYCKSCNFVDKPMNLLKDFRPDLEKYYDDTAIFSELAYQSNKEPFWKCDNGHRFKFPIYAMTRHKDFYCPECDTKVKRGVNDLETTDPELAKEFSPNNIKKAYEYSKSNVASVLWTCKECGNDYLYPINKRELNDKSCVYCYAGRVKTGYNDLQTVDPELAKEYSPNNEKPASQIRRDSGYKVLWICPTCGHEYPFRVKDRTVGDNHCACCNGKKFKKGFNDLLTMYPDIIKEWSDKNDKKPDEVYYNSYYFAQLNCSKCGDSYTAYVYDYYNNHEDVCPGCNDRRAVEGYNDLKTVYPKLIKEWSPNNPPMEEVLYKNKTQYKWICQKCGGEYLDTIQNRLDGVDNCNVCTDLVVQKGINDLVTTDPELAKEYSQNNVRKAYEIKKSHTIRVNWICPACNNEYQASPRDREIGDNICPYCNERKAIRGVNDLVTLKPDIVPEFSPRNNKNPEDIIADSENIYYWICPHCHGEYTYPVKDRHYNDDSCMYCNNRRVLAGFNDLATKKPELLSEYSDRNEKSASQVLYTTVMPALWKCPACNGEYNYPVKDRELNDNSCPYCNNKTVLPGYNDLATIKPELISEYSNKNERPITQILGNMQSPVLWTCPNCHGDYYYSVKDRRLNDNVCPYCNDKKVLAGYNDLGTLNPLLAEEYSSKNEKNFSEISPNSFMRAIWHCPRCEGEYIHPVKDRKVGDDSCPYCNDKKPLKGYNDLATTHPQVAEEWSEIENYLLGYGEPSDYAYKSSKTVWWKCKKCGNKYKMSISDRVMKDKRHHEPCNECGDRLRNRINVL